jgi:hypothetical protein
MDVRAAMAHEISQSGELLMWAGIGLDSRKAVNEAVLMKVFSLAGIKQ